MKIIKTLLSSLVFLFWITVFCFFCLNKLWLFFFFPFSSSFKISWQGFECVVVGVCGVYGVWKIHFFYKKKKIRENRLIHPSSVFSIYNLNICYFKNIQNIIRLILQSFTISSSSFLLFCVFEIRWNNFFSRGSNLFNSL